jgi:hypothetical protein
MGTRTTPKTLSIGDTFSGTGKLNGNISMFSVYNRSLSDTEVEQNFDALRGRYVI